MQLDIDILVDGCIPFEPNQKVRSLGTSCSGLCFSLISNIPDVHMWLNHQLALTNA